jgi:hypothetical protein
MPWKETSAMNQRIQLIAESSLKSASIRHD